MFSSSAKSHVNSLGSFASISSTFLTNWEVLVPRGRPGETPFSMVKVPALMLATQRCRVRKFGTEDSPNTCPSSSCKMDTDLPILKPVKISTIVSILKVHNKQVDRHAAVDKLKLALMPLSLFSEATDKDRGKFLDLNLPSFHAVIMIFCLNFCIGRWIGGDILFDSRLVLYIYNVLKTKTGFTRTL